MTRAVAVVALVVSMAPQVWAHPLSPALLELIEDERGTVAVTWRTADVRLRGAHFAPWLPEICRPIGGPAEVLPTPGRVTARWRVDCGASGLVGLRVGVEGLASGKTDALLRVQLRDGHVMQAVLRPGEAFVVISERPGRLGVAWHYGRLGLEHILEGPDHLLFVLGLVLLVATTRLLVFTITAFTVGHSITLSAAVLGVTEVPTRPVEVLIAASVLVLAVELARERPDTRMRRQPWLMAGGFGLLHGFGFAGALRATGLPEVEIPLALLAFNVGIEIGQIVFVVVVLAVGAIVGRLVGPARHAMRRPLVYVMGVLAAYWCMARLQTWLLG